MGKKCQRCEGERNAIVRYLGRGESGDPKCGWRMMVGEKEASPCKEEPVWGFAGDKQFRYLHFI